MVFVVGLGAKVRVALAVAACPLKSWGLAERRRLTKRPRIKIVKTMTESGDKVGPEDGLAMNTITVYCYSFGMQVYLHIRFFRLE